MKLTALAAVVLLSPIAATAAESTVHIDSPRGGWSRGTDDAQFRQPVDYPAASVGTPDGQPDAARIRGHIERVGKGDAASPRRPARLIVNGVAMPLAIGDDDTFDRPYGFPAGSNSVEVRAADGATRRLQFHRSGATGAPVRLRVLLSWDTDQTDLDLHVVTPDGGHAWYGAQVLDNGGALDVDVTTGFGPEIFATPSPLAGTYLVYVNYFGGGQAWNEDGELDPQEPLTTAQITIIANEGRLDEKQQSFIVPMRTAGELTLVRKFSYP